MIYSLWCSPFAPPAGLVCLQATRHRECPQLLQQSPAGTIQLLCSCGSRLLWRPPAPVCTNCFALSSEFSISLLSPSATSLRANTHWLWPFVGRQWQYACAFVTLSVKYSPLPKVRPFDATSGGAIRSPSDRMPNQFAKWLPCHRIYGIGANRAAAVSATALRNKQHTTSSHRKQTNRNNSTPYPSVGKFAERLKARLLLGLLNAED